MFNKRGNKKGVSPVVATVLLIVITVIIAAIILTFVLPFVDDKLGESKACLDVFDGVEFAQSNFNCYNETYQSSGIFASSPSNPPSSITMETGFSVRVKLEEIYGFRIGLIDEGSGSSETYDIVNSSTSTLNQVRMKGETWPSNSPLIVPRAGGIRTYIAENSYDKGEISVILESGQICSVADSIDFRHCTTGVDLN
jgi:flagellin-like protein